MSHTTHTRPFGHARCVWVLTALLALSLPLLAQTRPDVSGTWRMDEKRSGSATHEQFVGPVVWVIQASAQRVTLERRQGREVQPFVYDVLDKAPTARADTTVTSPSGDAPGHRAYWSDDRLVLETLQNIQGKTVTTKETLTLTNGGSELSVQRVLEVEHGYAMKGAQNFSAVTDVFAKVP